MSQHSKPGASVRPEMPVNRSARRWAWGSVALLSAVCMAGALHWSDIRKAISSEAKPQAASLNATMPSAVVASSADVEYSSEGWTYLGPNGGSASAIAFDPLNPSIAYAISEMGAVFKSTTGGARWEFIYQLPMQNAKLEVDATQSATLYAYTSVGRDIVNPPAGIHKSEDGGVTWSEIEPSQSSEADSSSLRYLNRIRTMPGHPGVLFAATSTKGLLRSVDGGVVWQIVRDSTSQSFGVCTELEIAPAKSKLYATCNAQPVVFQPDGSGATLLFQPALAEYAHQLKIAVAKSNQDVIYLAATKNWDGHSRLITRIYRSTDAGATWEIRFRRAMMGEAPTPESANPFNVALPGIFERDCENPAETNRFEDYQLAVDPSDANSLWVAGAQTYRSDNGGQTFGRAALDYYVSAGGLAFSPNYNGLSDQIAFIAGRDGIRRTTNARAAIQTYPTVTCSNASLAAPPAVVWAAAHDGYSAAMLLHGATFRYHSFAASLYTPSEFGTYLANDESVDSWEQLDQAAGQVVVSPGAELREVYTAGYAVNRWRLDAGTWGTNGAEPGGPLPSDGFHFPVRTYDSPAPRGAMHRLVQHPANTSTLLVPTTAGMYLSTDSAATWTRRGPAYAMSAAIFTRDGGILGASTGGIVSENPVGSGNWETRNLSGCLMSQSPPCPLQYTPIQEFVLSPVPDSKGIYAVSNGYTLPKLHYSADGRVWTELDRPAQPGGLPYYGGMTTLAVDPNNPNHLYVGTAYGLYASFDHGQIWAPVPTPFPLTPVSKLVIDRDANGNRRLFAFTFGRGAWAYQLPQSTTFADVPTYHWAYDYIGRLFNAGITTGCAATPLRYCADQRVLRDQMAVFLLRAKKGSAYQPPAAQGLFDDVPANHWAAAWIEQLRVDGITQGCATNPARYCPSDEVSREQMAVFLLRAKYGAAYQPPAAQGLFEDVPVSYWAAPWIEQLAHEGVTSGCSATPKLYCPVTPITRDQMAVFLVRAFGL